MKPAFKLPERNKVDDWVEGTPAKVAEDAKPRIIERVAPPTQEPKGKVARLTIDLDPELHAQFKAACAMGRTKMIDEVRSFIEAYVQKHR